MEWLNRMNEAIDYIEEHIGEKIDYSAAARIACCSLSRFQQTFVFAAGIPVSEYVRYRRMSLSAAELLNGDIKIIDLALKYGYESPEAFARAFQAFHGVSPTSARRLRIRTDYPRVYLNITVNGGNLRMGTKPIARIEEHGGERVVSFAVNCSGPEDAAGRLLRDWAVSNITDYEARRCIGCAPKGHHPQGTEHSPGEPVGTHEYVMQMFLYGNEGENGEFLGAEVRGAPEGLYLVGDVVLDEFGKDGVIDLGTSMQTAFGIMSECLKNMGGYEFDLQNRRHIEEQIFTKEWWACGDIGDAGLAGFKLWLPIVKL